MAKQAQKTVLQNIYIDILLYQINSALLSPLTQPFSKLPNLSKITPPTSLISHIPLTQAGFIKISKNLLISYLIISFAFSSIAGLFLFNPFGGGPKEAEAAWFNDNWAYRKTLTFTHNATVSSPSQVEFDIDTTAAPDQFQSDCGDVRFTMPNGDILPYWYDSASGACDTSSTDFDVLIPSIINGSNYIYMYYGNPSVSNGTVAADFSQSTTTPSGGAASAGSEEKSPSPVAYWKFDDAQGTTTEDTSVNNNDGTVNGATWMTEDQCISSKCLRFDGSDDYVQVTDAASLDVTTTFTIAAWVKLNNITSGGHTTDMTILNKGRDSTSTYAFTLQVCSTGNFACPGQAALNLYDGTNNPVTVSTTTFQKNTWYYVVATHDGSNTRMYINGNLEDTDANTVDPGVQTSPLVIGKNANASNRYFPGTIDEPKLYNQALSAAQILANYNARSNPEGISTALGANTQNMPNTLSNGLAGYWKMDESSWATDCSTQSVLDSSGNSITGAACPNASAAAVTTGKFGNGGSFDGTNDYVAITDNAVFDLTTTNNYSWAFWISPDDFENWNTVWSQASSGSSHFEINAHTVTSSEWGNVTAGVNVGWFSGASSNYISAKSTDNALTTDAWQHVVVTYDGSQSTSARFKIYVNGRDVTSSHNTNGTTSTISPTGTRFGGNEPLFTGENFDGEMDEMRYYNRALSNNEVSQLYNWAPGPSIYLKMDDGTGTTTTIDSSGNGKNGTFGASTQAPSWSTGKYGKALNYDGSDDYVAVASPSLPTADFTFETWFFANGVDNRILAAADGSSSQQEFALFYDFFGRIVVLTNNSTQITTSALSTGAWHHVAATRNGSTITVYLDGVAYATTATDSTAFSFSTCPLLIGALNGDASQCSTSSTYTDFWNGKFDEVKVYNYARTPGQIIEDMNGGHPAPGSPIGTPLLHYRFDEGADNMCSGGTNDVCNNGSTGTTFDATSTATRTKSGKFNGALDFDGSTQRTTATNANAIDYQTNMSTFTYSAWVNADSDGEGDLGQIFYKSPGTNYIRVDSQDGSNNLDLECNIDRVTTDTNVNIADAFNISTWNYIACSWDGTTARVYVNGQERGSSSSGSGVLDSDTGDYFIGGAATANFDGKIDEFKAYNFPLTTEQIKIDMNRSSSQVLGALSTSSDAQPNSGANEYCPPDSSTAVCTGPIGEWKFDEGSGTSAYDTSGNGNTGTLTGNGTPTTTSGKVGKALSFGGPGLGHRVNAGSAASLDNIVAQGGGGITVTAWINPTLASGNNHGIFNKWSSTGPNWQIVHGSGQAKFRFEANFSGGGDVDLVAESANNAVTSGVWQFVALTWTGSGTATTVHMYVNGREVTYGTQTNGTTTRDSDAGDSFIIGASTDSGGDPFLGKIDNFRVYNYVRTPAQLAWDYNKGLPIAHWRMDECQGSTINDITGNGAAGTLNLGAGGTTSAGTCTSSGAWFNGVTGKRNYSMALDGTDDYISGSDANFPANASDRTLSAWIKTSANADQTILSYGTATDNDQFYLAIYNLNGGGGGNCNNASTGGNRALIMGSGGSGGFNVCDNKSIIDGNWHHVVGTLSGSTASVYVDGQLRATHGSAAPTTALSGTFRIGNALNATVVLNGQVDDARIHNYALTATQVKALYNEGATRYGPVTGAP